MSDKPINLFTIPSSIKGNSYFELSFAAIRSAYPRVNIIALAKDNIWNIRAYLSRRDAATTQAKNIVHIHWPTVLFGSRYVLKSLFLIARNMLLLLVLQHFYGFKVVWTVHNVHAHDYPHPWIDTLGTAILRAIADLVVVQQQSTAALYREKYPHKRIVFVPHGNYVGAYGPLLPRDAAFRDSFDVKPDDTLILAIGFIMPYKCTEHIIDAVKKVRETRSDIKLLIAGRGDDAYVETLRVRAGGDPGIIIKNGFIPDDQVARHFSIADYSVLYYDASGMTSGRLLFSLSYGVPVIMQNIAAAEIITPENGMLFTDDADLVRVLVALPAAGVTHRLVPEAVVKTVAAYSWERSVRKLVAEFDSL